MAEVPLDWSVCSCPFTYVDRAQRAIANAFMKSKVMISWDVVSNVPDGRAPNGKQLWQAMWEDKLKETHQYADRKGLKAIGIAIFGGGEGCKYERDSLQTECGHYTAVIVPMDIAMFESVCDGGQIVSSMDALSFKLWVQSLQLDPDNWKDMHVGKY